MRFLIIFFVIGFIILIQSPAIMAESLSYNATTVEECIEEKACLKYVFMSEVVPEYRNIRKKEETTFRLEKWKEPISISFWGIDKKLEDEIIEYGVNAREVINSFKGFFPHPIEIVNSADSSNVLVLYGENLDQALKEKEVELGQYINPKALEVFRNNNFLYPKVLKFTEEHVYTQGAILIEDNDDLQPPCFLFLFSGLLGIKNATASSFLSLLDYDGCQITYLHKVMVSFLYHPQMKPGMNLKEVEVAFDVIYDELYDRANAADMSFKEIMDRFDPL